MKTLILLATVLMSSFIYGQDSLIIQEKLESRIFTVNPSKIVRNTTGINVGIMDDYKRQTVNGLNLQGNPFGFFYFLFYRVIPIPTESDGTASVNGLHISTGGMLDGNKLNGVGISMFHHARTTNGFTVNFFNNTSKNLSGLHISGFYNEAEIGNGLVVAIANNVENFNGLQLGILNKTGAGKGLQIGIYNKTKKQKGLQIGLINKTEAKKGLQVGFWNKNAKRTLPIINF